MELIRLDQGRLLGRAQQPMDYAYFPVDTVLSLVGTTTAFTVEIGIVGRESYLGLPVVLGKPVHPYQVLVQHPGQAWRVPATALCEALTGSLSLREHLLWHAHIRFQQFAQLSICHRFHHLKQRLCRWLLCMQDRVNTHELHVTHEGLARLLGSRRPTVNAMTNDLRKAGLVDYRRRSLVILDRKTLERLSCECYRLMAPEYSYSKQPPLSST